MEEDTYDVMIVAGDEPYWLSESLFRLAKDVGIPAPQFYGREVYCDISGAQKWMITTLIQGRSEDVEDLDMMYTEPYPDWSISVGMAIHGAISRICYKYRSHVTHGSAYRLFGERNEAGDAIDRGNQHNTAIRTHFMEREALSVGTEVLLQRQIGVIDAQRDRIRQMERAILKMDATIEDLKGKGEDKNAMIFGWQAQSAYFAVEYNEMDQVKKKNNALQEEIDELQKKIAQMTVDREEEKPQEKLELIPENQAEGDEEDPEERESWNTSDEDTATEESSPESDDPPKKRLKAPEYYKKFQSPA